MSVKKKVTKKVAKKKAINNKFPLKEAPAAQFGISLVFKNGDVKFLALAHPPMRIINVSNMGAMFIFSNVQSDASGNINFVYNETPFMTFDMFEGESNASN